MVTDSPTVATNPVITVVNPPTAIANPSTMVIHTTNSAPVTAVEYTVEIDLPSIYNDADILVDGSPANIIDRTPYDVKLKVISQDTPHKFQVKYKGTILREETRLVSSDDTIIRPFEN